nr:helix-turn-helix transcriptional regulator [Anaerofilum sp. An201]
MNERIAEVRKRAGLTQGQFAERIGLTRNYMWMIEKGERTPSDRTIADICREFAVNESWLRTGEGEMPMNLDKQKKIAAFVGDLMREENGSFKAQLIEMLSEMGPDEWALLEKMARRLTGR